MGQKARPLADFGRNCHLTFGCDAQRLPPYPYM
jgi:hypothetical protein